MSDQGRKAGNIIKNFLDAVTPEPSSEKLIFRRFVGSGIVKAAKAGTAISSKDIETVALKINPENLSFSKRKIIQKVQTSAPGRFVIFDWGSELTVLSIVGNTGLLLPAAITKQATPIQSTIEDLLVVTGQDPSGFSAAAGRMDSALGGGFTRAITQNALLSGSTYFETLNMSPKYQTFKKLEKMYDMQDADSDVLTLELGDTIYRGFFEEFTFEINAENPWNWKYNITFIILANISEDIRRWDETFNSVNIKKEAD